MATGVANAVRKYRKVQIGVEGAGTYGIEVAGTRSLRIIDLAWNDSGSQRTYTPDYTIGRFTRRTDVPTVTRSGLAGSSIGTDFSFEDVLWPLSSFKGLVVASAEKTAGQGDREWIYLVDPNTIDVTPDSYTMERRLGATGTNWDATAPGVLVESFEISADSEGDVTKMKVNFWSRATNTNAIAGPLALPTPFTPLAALSWKLYINNTWGAMDTFAVAPSYAGGAQISTTITGFTWRTFTGNDPALYIGDGRTDPSKHRPMPRGTELELTVEYNAAVETERLAAIAGTKRYVRLLGEGARIGTGFNKTMLMQGAFVYPDGGFGEIGGSTNEMETVTLKLESLPDDDTEDVEFHVINTLATFP